MFRDGSERSCDVGFYSNQTLIRAATDPRYPSAKCRSRPGVDHIHANSGRSKYPVQELLNDNSNVGTDLGGNQRNRYRIIRQRILVEE